jgi:diaminopimelate decarboxylase
MIRLLDKLLPTPNYRSLLPTITPVKATPSYVVDKTTVASRLNDLQKALALYSFKSKIAFSFKTNYDFATSDFLPKNHLLAETVSEHEYQLAKKLGFNSQKIILNGPNKGDLRSVLKTNSLIHFDNFAELDELVKLASILTPTATLGLRLRTAHVPSRFGFDIDSGDAQKAIDILEKNNLPLESIHVHLGSDLYDPSLYQLSAISLGQFVAGNFLKIKYLDFGGGYPAHGATPLGRSHQKTYPINTYIKAISKFYDQIDYSPTLILEPGRYLIDDAVYFVTKVINKSTDARGQVLTVDATINMLPSLWYRPATIETYHPDLSKNQNECLLTTAYGSSCQEHDLLFQGQLANCQVGDIIVFLAVGAYNQSMAPNFIFPAPKTILVP